MSEKETEEKCPKCGQKLSKIYNTDDLVKEKKIYIGYFCSNCGVPFKIEEVK